MWKSIKEDPILKTIVVIVLGILAFGFAFNIMFGSSVSGMESGEMMGGGGYSLGNTLTYTLSLLIKITLILIVVGAIILTVKLIKKYIIDQNKINLPDLSNKGPILRYLIYGAGVLIVLMLLSSLGFNSTMQNNAYGNSQFGVLYIGKFLIKVLLFLSITSLTVATFMYMKNNNDTISDNSNASKCDKCGIIINAHWNCCPNCGNDIGSVARNASKEEDNTEDLTTIS